MAGFYFGSQILCTSLGERWAGHPCCSSLLSPSSWTSLALLKKDCSFALLSLTFMHRRFGLPTLFFQVIILSSLSVYVDEPSSAPWHLSSLRSLQRACPPPGSSHIYLNLVIINSTTSKHLSLWTSPHSVPRLCSSNRSSTLLDWPIALASSSPSSGPGSDSRAAIVKSCLHSHLPCPSFLSLTFASGYSAPGQPSSPPTLHLYPCSSTYLEKRKKKPIIMPRWLVSL